MPKYLRPISGISRHLFWPYLGQDTDDEQLGAPYFQAALSLLARAPPDLSEDPSLTTCFLLGCDGMGLGWDLGVCPALTKS